MLLDIFHRTHYKYDASVKYALFQVRQSPASCTLQNVISWEIELVNGRKELDFMDHNSNQVWLISIEPDHREIDIRCQGKIETRGNAGILGKYTGHTPLWYYSRDTALTRPGPAIRKLVQESGLSGNMEPGTLHQLSERIASSIRYEVGTTSPTTTAEEALRTRCGVCQDHTHVFVTAARLLGFPARYVSGYLMMDGQIHQQASHAWAEAWVESLGWVGFDVSNGISPDDRYVRTASGLDYREAAPVQGIRFGESRESMSVQLQIQQQSSCGNS